MNLTIRLGDKGVKQFPRIVSNFSPLIPRRYTLTELTIEGTPDNNATQVDFYSLEKVELTKLVLRNTNIVLIDNPIVSKNMKHIEVIGCQYINRKQFEYQDLK